MPLETIEIESAPSPTASLIILHGLGADGEDFVPFCHELDLQGIGPLRFVLPSAPVIPVSLHGGHPMRAWYDIFPRHDAKREDEASLRATQPRVDALIEREVARGIPSERIVLMGFSQGCAMTLMCGLRQAHKLGGLIALSGYLPLPESTATEAHRANRRTPIFMAHGIDDDVVHPERGQRSLAHLLSLDYLVSWHDYPMGHSLCLDEVNDINTWLKQILRPPRGPRASD